MRKGKKDVIATREGSADEDKRKEEWSEGGMNEGGREKEKKRKKE